jgi:hypothetical protein
MCQAEMRVACSPRSFVIKLTWSQKHAELFQDGNSFVQIKLPSGYAVAGNVNRRKSEYVGCTYSSFLFALHPVHLFHKEQFHSVIRRYPAAVKRRKKCLALRNTKVHHRYDMSWKFGAVM